MSRPRPLPAFYTVPRALVTTGDKLVVASAETSGEAEFVLVPGPHGVLIGAGSDHTDRAREAIGVAESKTLCGKVMSRKVWPLRALERHWGSPGAARLDHRRQWPAALPGGTPGGTADARAAPGRSPCRGDDYDTALVFSGTLPTIGGFAFGSHFEVELPDPVLHRRLHCAYEVVTPTG